MGSIQDLLQEVPLAAVLRWREVFAGWDWIAGYRKADIIKQMIESI